jgi:hypothetical protein
VQPERQRLRFEEVLHKSQPDGRCRVGVRLEWCGRIVQASAEGVETQHGRVRAAAVATLEAALDGAGKRVDFELVGVKAFRAFDGWVVVVRLNAETEAKSYRLLGSASCEDDEALLRAAAHAVLDATNRLLARFIQPPSGQGSEGQSASRTPPRE